MSTFESRLVLAFESRRAKEIESLIATFGGRPMVAPAMKELPLESEASALAFTQAIARGDFDAVIFLTGVGVQALVTVADHAGAREAFLAALRRLKVITRGPKPVAVLRELQVPIWFNAPEPNTWREIMQVLAERSVEWPLSGKRVAIQEYGVPNPELQDALREHGATVTAVQAYRWAMPTDVEPLRRAAAAASRSEVDVLLITSGIQFVHFWNVVSDLGLEDQVRRGLSRTIIASIGPSASAELRRHGFEPTFEPSHPKMGLLVREAAERVPR